MRILITGNMGYIGPILVSRLRQTRPGAEIIGLDAGFFAHCLTGADYLPECRVDLQRFHDVRDAPRDWLEGIDAVVHLAAVSNDPIGKAFEAATAAINHAASVDLARKAKEAGARAFVFASSCSMYGAGGDAAKTENASLNPLTAYARSKVATERDIEALAGDGFVVTSLRFATACGWSPRLRLDLVLNDFVAGAVASGKITVLSDGSPWRPLIHVKDMARAIDWAIGRESERGGTFLAVNAGSDAWNYQIKDLAEAVAQCISGVELSINRDALPDKRSYRVDFSRFAALAPDHQPKVGLAEAVAELEEGLRTMRFANPDFRESAFMRLMALRGLMDAGRIDHNLHWTL